MSSFWILTFTCAIFSKQFHIIMPKFKASLSSSARCKFSGSIIPISRRLNQQQTFPTLKKLKKKSIDINSEELELFLASTKNLYWMGGCVWLVNYKFLWCSKGNWVELIHFVSAKRSRYDEPTVGNRLHVSTTKEGCRQRPVEFSQVQLYRTGAGAGAGLARPCGTRSSETICFNFFESCFVPSPYPFLFPFGFADDSRNTWAR